MPFIQLVEFETRQPVDEVKKAIDAWLDATSGRRALRMAVVAAERDKPNRYWELLEYASEAEARSATELPETKAAFDKWSGLLDGEPTFHNLSVVEELGGPESPSPGQRAWKTPGGG